MTLRAAVAADAPRVADLLIDTREAFLPYAPLAHTHAELRAWVAEHLVPSGVVVVAELAGRVVGMTALRREPDASWIDQMAVDPAHVNAGIGTRLLLHALAE